MVVCAEMPNKLKSPHVGHCPCEKIRKIVYWVGQQSANAYTS